MRCLFKDRNLGMFTEKKDRQTHTVSQQFSHRLTFGLNHEEYTVRELSR